MMKLMRSRRLGLFAIVSIIVAAVPTIGFAGTTGVVNGTVYDCGQAIPCARPMPRVPFAKVVVHGDFGEYATTADAQGWFFSFVSLPPGHYYLLPAKEGYRTWCIAYAKVWADQVTSVVVELTTQRFIDHCYRRFSPASTLSTWSMDSSGNLDR